MPGRTAADAFRMFVEPLQDALACLGSAKITTSPGGRGDRRNPEDGFYTWSINGFDGISQGPLTLRASMEYRFIDR